MYSLIYYSFLECKGTKEIANIIWQNHNFLLILPEN